MIDVNAIPGWVFLVGGVLLLLSAFNGIIKGSASVFVSPGFNRSENPVQYWTAIVMLALAGASGIYVFISDMMQ